MTQVAQLLMQAQTTLADCGEDTPRLTAEILLAFTLSKSRSWLYAWPEANVDDHATQQFQTLIESRAAGEPVAYLTGTREFWSLAFKITSDTLIPRPETELLVETALELGDAQSSLSLLDLGTGSGAIAIAIASERKQWCITATDSSIAALEVARVNAASLVDNRVELIQSNWFAAFTNKQQYHIIVSNPPYIEEDDHHLQQGDLRFEPASALCSGPAGLDDLQVIISEAPAYLSNDGWLIVEHGMDQREPVQQLFRNNNFNSITTVKDLEHRDRISFGQKQQDI